MTDTNDDGYRVTDVVVAGNRRFPNSGGSFGAPPESGGEVADTRDDNPNPETPYQWDPCDTPSKRFDKAADALAAQTLKDIKSYSANNPETKRGTDRREYGAALWIMPDGQLVRGPITSAEFAFDEAHLAPEGRAGVLLDVTSPSPYAVEFGSVHTHNPGAYVLSGLPDQSDGDQYLLARLRGYLAQTQYSPDRARLYVAADPLGPALEPGESPGPMKMTVYNHLNAAAAAAGAEGPEVDPEGQPCP